MAKNNPGVEVDDNHTLDDGASEQDAPSKQAPKRAKTSKGAPSVPRKKHVRGKQGALKGIMQMPIEIFTEIASHVTPADLITLVRTNKFFRSILLRRSTILTWQRAQGNVPGLPPLPTGMSEPQYAALMFSKFCTYVAGVPHQSRTRGFGSDCVLCAEIQREASEYSVQYQYIATTRFIKTPKDHGQNLPARLVDEELQQALQIRQGFIDKKDHEGLKEWESRTLTRLETQRTEAKAPMKFIDSTGRSREQELETLKRARQKEVNDRLKALGWEEKYLSFPDGPEARQWDSLVKVPKPLTDRIWTNLAPRLIALLESNRRRVEEGELQRRRFERSNQLTLLMRQLKDSMYPYHKICDALDIEPPGPTRVPAEITRAIGNPFPQISHAIVWDVLADICDGEYSLEQIEELFNERREKIKQRVLQWREEAEHQLFEQYMLDAGETTAINDVVKINGSADATESLSPYARFLLRADTIFITRYWQQVHNEIAQGSGYGPMITGAHFPSILAGMDESTLNLDNYIRHVDAEKIVKALLKDLEMPDAAYVELLRKHKAFACLRCKDLSFGTWNELILHYQKRSIHWIGDNPIGNKYTTRHPVPFFHTHRLDSGPNAKPLARMMSKEESRDERPLNYSKVGLLRCLLCSGAGLTHGDCATTELLEVHMDETHGITDVLARGLHYEEIRNGLHHQSRPTTAWQAKWDAYYDKKAKDGAVNNGLENDSDLG